MHAYCCISTTEINQLPFTGFIFSCSMAKWNVIPEEELEEYFNKILANGYESADGLEMSDFDDPDFEQSLQLKNNEEEMEIDDDHEGRPDAVISTESTDALQSNRSGSSIKLPSQSAISDSNTLSSSTEVC